MLRLLCSLAADSGVSDSTALTLIMAVAVGETGEEAEGDEEGERQMKREVRVQHREETA